MTDENKKGLQDLQNVIANQGIEMEKLRSDFEAYKSHTESELKFLTHELAGAIQILMLSVDSIENHPERNITQNLERIRRASNNMANMINKVRNDHKKESKIQMIK